MRGKKTWLVRANIPVALLGEGKILKLRAVLQSLFILIYSKPVQINIH